MRVLASIVDNTRSSIKYADFAGYYRFALEGEEMLINFYAEDGVLYGVGEYSLGELKPVTSGHLVPLRPPAKL